MFFLHISHARCWIVVCCARAICQIAQISSTIRAWFADLSDFSNTLHTILGESSQTIIVWMWSSIGTWIFDIDLLCCLCLFFFSPLLSIRSIEDIDFIAFVLPHDLKFYLKKTKICKLRHRICDCDCDWNVKIFVQTAAWIHL